MIKIWVLIFLSCVLVMSTLGLDNPEHEITKVIEDYVIARNPEWAGLNISVTFKHADKIFSGLRALDGKADLEVVAVYEDFKPVGNVIFPIQVSLRDQVKKIFVRTRVAVFKKIVVASRLIKRGAMIVLEDIELQERDIAMLPQKYFVGVNAVLLSQAKTSIPKNSAIFEWMIKEVPLVKRGDGVAILVKGENLLLRADGRVLEDGYLGKPIKVRRRESRKTLDGVLISTNEVEVILK